MSAELLRAVARDLLFTSTTAGRFDVPIESQYNFSNGGVRYRYELPDYLRRRLPPSVSYVDGLMEALDEHALQRTTNEALLGPLRHKSMLILGDSTDYNLWSRMCHCPRTDRKKGREYGEEVVGTMVNNSALIACHGQKDFETCDWRQLDFQIHFMDGAYGVHPYDGIPYHRPEFMPDCTLLDLEECLEAKWRRSANDRYGFECFHRGALKTPELMLINVNIWYWLRISWYGKYDPPAVKKLSISGHHAAYKRNATRLLNHMQRLLPAPSSVWALHTSVLPIGRTTYFTKDKARVPLPKMATLNSAIRSLSHYLQLGLADWDAMLHLGWDRKGVLRDDMHTYKFFNTAIGNVYLNSLRIAPRAPPPSGGGVNHPDPADPRSCLSKRTRQRLGGGHVTAASAGEPATQVFDKRTGSWREKGAAEGGLEGGGAARRGAAGGGRRRQKG